MRYGFWLPVFGGWLRNVEGEEAPSLDAWSTAAALAATTESLELMVAVRPTFHNPALLAKQAANIDHISGGRLSLNVVSSWWATEARKYGVDFDDHDRRYQRSEEWLEIVDRAWKEDGFSYGGDFYRVEENVLRPKPVQTPRPTIYAGGESPAGKDFISRTCDAWLTHGDPPEVLAPKFRDMDRRREAAGRPPMTYGVAGFVVLRDTEEAVRTEVARITDVKQSSRGHANYRDWIENTNLERTVSVEDYSVSNRGLRTGLVGTPDQVAERIRELESAGCELLLLQFSPQFEEMERFAEEVIPRV